MALTLHDFPFSDLLTIRWFSALGSATLKIAEGRRALVSPFLLPFPHLIGMAACFLMEHGLYELGRGAEWGQLQARKQTALHFKDVFMIKFISVQFLYLFCLQIAEIVVLPMIMFAFMCDNDLAT